MTTIISKGEVIETSLTSTSISITGILKGYKFYLNDKPIDFLARYKFIPEYYHEISFYNPEQWKIQPIKKIKNTFIDNIDLMLTSIHKDDGKEFAIIFSNISLLNTVLTGPLEGLYQNGEYISPWGYKGGDIKIDDLTTHFIIN